MVLVFKRVRVFENLKENLGIQEIVENNNAEDSVVETDNNDIAVNETADTAEASVEISKKPKIRKEFVKFAYNETERKKYY